MRALGIAGGSALAVTGASIVVPAVTVGVLNLLGFGAAGPVAGESLSLDPCDWV